MTPPRGIDIGTVLAATSPDLRGVRVYRVQVDADVCDLRDLTIPRHTETPWWLIAFDGHWGELYELVGVKPEDHTVIGVWRGWGDPSVSFKPGVRAFMCRGAPRAPAEEESDVS